jgi:hypothetical protein
MLTIDDIKEFPKYQKLWKEFSRSGDKGRQVTAPTVIRTNVRDLEKFLLWSKGKTFFFACRDNNTRYHDNGHRDLELDPMAQGAVTVMDLTALVASLSSTPPVN